MRRDELVARVAVRLIDVVCVIWCASYAKAAIVALAGQATFADIAIKFVTNRPAGLYTSWAMTAVAVVAVIVGRRALRGEIARLHDRTRTLERRLISESE